MNIKRTQYYLNMSMYHLSNEIYFTKWHLLVKIHIYILMYQFNITIKSCEHKFLSNISVEETHVNVDIVFGF